MSVHRRYLILVIISLSLVKHDIACAYISKFRYGDLNRDFIVNLTDLSFFFKYSAMNRDSSEPAVPDSIFQRLDFNKDGVIDIVDTQHEVRAIGGVPYGEQPYFNPIYTPPDNLQNLNAVALALSREHLTELKILWPDLRVQLERMLRQFGLTEKTPVPVNEDINEDGYIDVTDIVRLFTLLADSLYELPNLPVSAGMDFNVDGQVDLIDTENFLWQLSSCMYHQMVDDSVGGWDMFTQTYDGRPAPVLGEKAGRFASLQIAWVLEKAYSESSGFLDTHLKDLCTVFGLPFPPPRPWPGDIDADSLRTAADAAQFFNFLFDKAPAGMYREDLDFNLDSRVDSLDAEYFLFFLFREGRALSTPSGQSMSRNSLRRTISFLEDMENRHPEWVDQSGKSMLGPLLQALLPLPVTDSLDADLNQDGRVNILDLLTLLRWGAQGDSRADWSGDNAFTGEDILMFLGRLQR